MAATAVAAGAGIAGSILSSRESKKNRKSAEKQAQAAVDQAKTELDFAKEQFKLFQPVIRNFTNFFEEVPLEDITSGRVVATGAQQAINSLNVGAEDARRRLDADLARRGVSADDAGQAIRSEFELGLVGQKAAIQNAAVQDEINNRLQLVGLGVGQVPSVLSAGQGVTNALQSNSNRLATLAAQDSALAQQSASSAAQLAIKGLSNLRGSGGDQTGIDDQQQQALNRNVSNIA